jgi:uncharacterized protein DUF2569
MPSWRLIGWLFLLLASAAPALADSQSRAPGLPGCGGLILLYICASRKDKDIGGWLLYYYIQLYLGVIITIVVSATSFENYIPRTWAEAPELYPWFLLSTIPALLLTPAQLVAAEVLRVSRNGRHLKTLRLTLWLQLAFAFVETAIDLRFFSDNLIFDGLHFLWCIIWIPYFYVSKRVKRVFAQETPTDQLLDVWS